MSRLLRMGAALCLLAAPSLLPRTALAQTNVLGEWGPLQQWPIRSIHSAMLPTGKVLFWTRTPEGTQPRLYDPTTNTLAAINGPGYEEFCSSHNFLPDGTLLILGGHNTQDGDGLPYASVYDPFTNTYTRKANMNAGRWYPSSVMLGSGDVVVMAGTYGTTSTHNDLPQVYSNGTWRDLTTARQIVPLYPDIVPAPNGKLFMLGPNQMSQYLDTAGTGAWSNVGNRTFGNRDYGFYCQYETGKILYGGGGDPPTRSAEVIDLNQAAPTWRAVGQLGTARRQANCLLLPDGKVLITGGTSGAGFNNLTTPVLTAELWDPATEQFTALASMVGNRWYHSTTVLLPDGRVLSSGGDNNLSMELYSPPYLFKGARPTITSAPSVVGMNQSFVVQTPDATGISAVNLVKLSSVTHSNNFDQRIVKLSFTKQTGQVTATTPSTVVNMPPGYYMLFVLNSSGVPSVAKMVRVDPQYVPGTGTGLRGEYFTNYNYSFTGAPTLTRVDATVNFDWGVGAPGTGLGINGFSTRWSGQVQAPVSGSYTFTTNSDDGIRLWVNGQQLINNWTDHGPTLNSGTLTLTAGQRYDIKLEYYENGGGAIAQLFWSYPGQAQQIVPASALYPAAVAFTLSGTAGNQQASLSWTPYPGAASYTLQRATAAAGPFTTVVSGLTATSATDTGRTNGTTYYYRVQALSGTTVLATTNVASVTPSGSVGPGTGTGLTAQYFNNLTLTGTPIVTRVEPGIDFSWVTTALAPGVNVDGFSTRWSGFVQPRYSGVYTFTTTSDDGVRLWVNGQQLVNNWTDHGPTENAGTITLVAGQKYAVTVEYYDSSGGATLKLEWEHALQPRQIIPKEQLYIN
ncbi:PA14 domain-containing protein [Armatimonas rosea]|uniref:PA14 domain-containing protein n=1 Tax=Armatimonas rosea TaxID=685828 RepID=A0A7W9SRA9_ARMRO|nr:PA14 domain-containing protein [Armatimonas rosea]MBB6051371.1 hypothetical protein [Armatimonas rosea]